MRNKVSSNTFSEARQGAEQFMNKKEYLDALQLFEKARKDDRDNVEIYIRIGGVLVGLKRFDEAIKYFLIASDFIIRRNMSMSEAKPSGLIYETLKMLEEFNNSLPLGFSFDNSIFIKIKDDIRWEKFLANPDLIIATGFSFICIETAFRKYFKISDDEMESYCLKLLDGNGSEVWNKCRFSSVYLYVGLFVIFWNTKVDKPRIKIDEEYLKFDNQIICPMLIHSVSDSLNYKLRNVMYDKSIFLDRNPCDLEMDYFLLRMRDDIKEEFDLEQVYLGYNLLTPEINHDPAVKFAGFANVGSTSTLCYDLDELNQYIKKNKAVYLCFLAFPIDDMDFLLENEWEDIELEQHLRHKFRLSFVVQGAVRSSEGYKCRTFKFIYTA